MAKEYRYRPHLEHAKRGNILFTGLILLVLASTGWILQRGGGLGNEGTAIIAVLTLVVFATSLGLGRALNRLMQVRIELDDDGLTQYSTKDPVRIGFDEINELRFSPARIGGSWMKIVGHFTAIRLTVLLDGLGDLVRELKAQLDRRSMSHLYDDRQLFAFLKRAEYSGQSWDRLYEVFGLVTTGSGAMAATAVGIAAGMPLTPLTAGVLLGLSIAWPLLLYTAGEYQLARYLAKRSDPATFTVPERDHDYERRVWLRTGGLGLLLFLVASVALISSGHVDSPGHANRGEHLYRGRYDAALAEFDHALKLDPRDTRSLYGRGNCWLMKGEYERAAREFDQAIRLDPDQTPFYYRRGLALTFAGKLDEAIADFDTALHRRPGFPEALASRGRAFWIKGELEKALDDFDRVLQMRPDLSTVYDARAGVYREMKQFPQAIEDWERAIELDRRSASAHNGLGWMYATCPDEEFRDGAAAIRHALLACQITSWTSAAYIDTLAAAHAEAGNFEEAVRYQTKAANMTDDAGMKERVELFRNKQPYRE